MQCAMSFQGLAFSQSPCVLLPGIISCIQMHLQVGGCKRFRLARCSLKSYSSVQGGIRDIVGLHMAQQETAMKSPLCNSLRPEMVCT